MYDDNHCQQETQEFATMMTTTSSKIPDVFISKLTS